MGCLTWLVSDEKKEYCDLGKVFLDDGVVDALKNAAGDALRQAISAAIQDADYNAPTSAKEAARAAEIAAAWMEAHPDWRFLTEYDEAYENVYLAEDEADAAEYMEEFGSDDLAEGWLGIYKKTGSVWKEERD